MNQTKICSKCNIEKEVTEFNKAKLGKYGVRSTCKQCVRLYEEANAERIAAYRKQYYQANKYRILEQAKQYQDVNKEKIAEYKLDYQKLNKEKIAEKNRLYREHKGDELLEKKRKYHHDNKEKIAEKSKLYREKNKARLSEKRKQYYYDHRDKLCEYYKEYRKNNIVKISKYQQLYFQTPMGKASKREMKHKRRALKINNTIGDNFTKNDVLKLFELQSAKCVYCKTKLLNTGKNKFHIDHVIPLSKGGSNDISNIQLLCPKCNLSKSNKLPEEFAGRFGMLI